MKPSQAELDTAKLCDYRFYLALSSRDKIFPVIDRVRRQCLAKYTDDLPTTLQLSSNTIGEFEWRDGPRSLIPIGPYNWVRALCDLYDSIRSLKSALRRTMHGWDYLHGEVNFDELLIVSSLIETFPPAADLIRALLDRFGRASDDNRVIPLNEDDQRTISYLWKKHVPITTPHLHEIKILVNRLIPQCSGEPVISAKLADAQRVRYSSPTSYFTRAVNLIIPATEIRDQSFLKQLAEWRRRGEQTFVQSLSRSNEFGAKCEQFSFLLSDDDVANLLPALFSLIRNAHGRSANARCEGFLELWRISLKRRPFLYSTLRHEVGLTLPISIRFANDIYYYWATREHPILTHDERPALRRDIHVLAKSCFGEGEKSAENLSRAFDPGFPWSLYHLVFTTEKRNTPDDLGVPLRSPSDWCFLAPAITKSLEIDPTNMVAQVACFMFEREDSNPIHLTPVVLNQQAASEFFRDDLPRAMKVLAAFDGPKHLDPQVDDYVRSASRIAKEWLEKNDRA